MMGDLCCSGAINQVYTASFPHFKSSLDALSVDSKVFTLQGQAWQLVITPSFESNSTPKNGTKKKFVSVYIVMVPPVEEKVTILPNEPAMAYPASTHQTELSKLFASFSDHLSSKAPCGGGNFRFWLACLHKNNPELTYVTSDVVACDCYYSDMGYSCYLPHDRLSEYLIGEDETLCIQVVVERLPSLVTSTVHVILESELLSLDSPRPRSWNNILQKGIDSDHVPRHMFLFGRFDHVHTLRKKLACTFNICPTTMQVWRVNNTASLMKKGKENQSASYLSNMCSWPSNATAGEMTLLETAHEKLHGTWAHLRWKLLHAPTEPLVFFLRTTAMNETVLHKYLLQMPYTAKKSNLNTLRCTCIELEHCHRDTEHDTALVLLKYLDLGCNERNHAMESLSYLGSLEICIDLSMRRIKVLLETLVRSHRQAVNVSFISGSWRCAERISIFLEPGAGTCFIPEKMKMLDDSETLRNLNVWCGAALVVVTHPHGTDALVAAELRMLYQNAHMYTSLKVLPRVREWSLCGSHHRDVSYFMHVSDEHMQLVSARKEVDRARHKCPACSCCSNGARRSFNLKCLAKRKQSEKLLEKSYDCIKKLYENMNYTLLCWPKDDAKYETDDLDRITQEILDMDVNKKKQKNRRRKRAEKKKQQKQNTMCADQPSVKDQIMPEKPLIHLENDTDVRADSNSANSSMEPACVAVTHTECENAGHTSKPNAAVKKDKLKCDSIHDIKIHAVDTDAAAFNIVAEQLSQAHADDGAFTTVVVSRKWRERSKDQRATQKKRSARRNTAAVQTHNTPRRSHAVKVAKLDNRRAPGENVKVQYNNRLKQTTGQNAPATLLHPANQHAAEKEVSNSTHSDTLEFLLPCIKATDASSEDITPVRNHTVNDATLCAADQVAIQPDLSPLWTSEQADKNSLDSNIPKLACLTDTAAPFTGHERNQNAFELLRTTYTHHRCAQSDVSGPSSLVSDSDPVFVPCAKAVGSRAVQNDSRRVHVHVPTLFGLPICVVLPF
jgi:hypothetical protein